MNKLYTTNVKTSKWKLNYDKNDVQGLWHTQANYCDKQYNWANDNKTKQKQTKKNW